MIRGIGIDIVTVDRFNRWVEYPEHQLQKTFTAQELTDCRGHDGILIAEKLATRFAAKEAFYKALSATLVRLGVAKQEFSLRSILPYVSVKAGEWGVPVLYVDWTIISSMCGVAVPRLFVHLSLSHETTAIAFVIIEDAHGA